MLFGENSLKGKWFLRNIMSHIEFRQENHLGFIILNRPEKRNALSFDTLNQLEVIINELKCKKDIKVVIVKGNGKDFCSGHDLKEFVEPKRPIQHYRNVFSLSVKIMESLHRLPQVFIAQVQGHASAAGCQLVASCDLAVAEKHALFSTPGVKIGLFCSTPMVPLYRSIGRKHALEMLLTGRDVTADQALSYGLINKVVEKKDLEDETIMLAHELSNYSSLVLSVGKQTFYKQTDLSESNAYDLTKETIALNCLFDDAQEGIMALIEKRSPQWARGDDEENP